MILTDDVTTSYQTNSMVLTDYVALTDDVTLADNVVGCYWT